MSRGKRKAAWIAGGVLVVLAGQCLGFCWVPGLDVFLYLLVGWIPYLKRVTPQIDVRWDLVASTLAYAAALVVGSHLFLRWLYRETRKRGEGSSTGTDAGAPAWRWRWTLGGFVILVLMFAAGTAVVGITHQTAWLARSPQPLYRPGSPGRIAQRIRCGANLRSVGQALAIYAGEHGGQFPDDLSVLVADGHVFDDRMLKCPAEYDAPPDGISYEQQAAEVAKPGHISYLYFGKGMSSTGRGDRVVVVEPLEHHDGKGINVLYDDGHTAWIEAPEAETLLLGLGFQRVEAPPRR